MWDLTRWHPNDPPISHNEDVVTIVSSDGQHFTVLLSTLADAR
jgi:hypothetical protein